MAEDVDEEDRSPDTGVFSLINEYGDAHVANVYQLLAISNPLTIWAPSGLLLEHHLGADGVDTVIDAMDAGHMRVLARDDWLSNGPRRRARAKRWHYAEWHPRLDEAIQQRLNSGAKSVRVAPRDAGRPWARRYLDEHPGTADIVKRLVETRDPSLPIGTLDRASEKAGIQKAVEVLRDYHNHAGAYLQSGAHLDSYDVQWGYFQERVLTEIAHATVATPSVEPVSVRPALVPQFPVDAAVKLLEVLSPAITRKQIQSFLGTKEHQYLADWMHAELRVLARDADVDLLTAHLASDLASSLRITDDSKLRRRLDQAADAASAATIGSVLAPVVLLSLFAVLSLGLGVVALGKTVYRVAVFTELVSPRIEPTWPFAYAGKKQSPRQLDHMMKRLRTLAELSAAIEEE